MVDSLEPSAIPKGELVGLEECPSAAIICEEGEILCRWGFGSLFQCVEQVQGVAAHSHAGPKNGLDKATDELNIIKKGVFGIEIS
jgi:hypothetical protein